MSENKISLATSSIFINLLLFFTVCSTAQSNNNNCASSSCGDIKISYPFRLTSSPKSCGYDAPSFALECSSSNQTIFTSNSRRYIVKDINYEFYSIRLVDASINSANLSSCPVLPNDYDAFSYLFTTSFFEKNIPVFFIHCLSPANSSKYVEAPFCGNRNRISSNSSQIYSYVMQGDWRTTVSDVEESCAVDRVVWASGRKGISVNSSLAAIYEDLGYGVELTWFLTLCEDCEGHCSLEGNRIKCKHYCMEDTPYSERSFKCKMEYWGMVGIIFYIMIGLGVVVAVRFVIGSLFLIGYAVPKWRKLRQLPIYFFHSLILSLSL